MRKLKIKGVVPDTIAHQHNIKAGDFLLSINGIQILDILDVLFLMEEEHLNLQIEKVSGACVWIEITRDYDQEVGLEFEEGILDQASACSNRCLFCFIDQLPKGMRPSLYFKDDDSRLSFLQGNFVTLTNLGESIFKRLIEYRISPINVSVHTTNAELRIKMLKNKKAGLIMKQLFELAKARIQMNGQIVLVPGYNDGEELTKSLMDLASFYPHMQSVAIVPVGLTKFREGLEVIEPMSKAATRALIKQVETLQKQFLNQMDTRFAFLADEFYIKAEKRFPPNSHYEGYVQLENGIGLMKKLACDVKKALKKSIPLYQEKRTLSLVTGKLAQPFIQAIIDQMTDRDPFLTVQVFGIENWFFGPQITVSGLITGKDIIGQLKFKNLGQALLLPENLLKADEYVLLDDVTVQDIQEALSCKVVIVPSTGEGFVEHILNRRFE